MTKHFRKVPCSERLPEPEKPVIVIFENEESLTAHVEKNGNWFIDMPSLWPSDCDQPEYWLESFDIPDQGPDLINFLLTNALLHLTDEERLILCQSLGDRLGQKVYTHADMLASWDAALSHALKLKGYYRSFKGFMEAVNRKK